MPRPCADRHPDAAATEAGCVACRLYRTNRKYYLHWGGDPAAWREPARPPVRVAPETFRRGSLARALRDKVPCVHRGEPTGERRQCLGCGQKNKRAPVHACARHGQCSVDGRVEGAQWCTQCDDYLPLGRFPTRNLIYHVCPTAGNGAWQRNIEQLLRRIDLFTGRRVVAIVTGQAKRLDYRATFELDSPAAVKAAFKGHVHEFIEVPNDPGLREVVTFVPLLERVCSGDPQQITFYAHAKGVTRPVNAGVTVHRWADLMYESLLDYAPLVEATLERHPIAGSFKKVGAGFTGSESSWHYSGSFWWFCNQALYADRAATWSRADPAWWGSEAWPGLHFAPEEAGCVFHGGRVPGMDLFSMRYFKGIVEPAWEKWKADNAWWRYAPWE